jgi:hypothetical protein
MVVRPHTEPGKSLSRAKIRLGSWSARRTTGTVEQGIEMDQAFSGSRSSESFVLIVIHDELTHRTPRKADA